MATKAELTLGIKVEFLIGRKDTVLTYTNTNPTKPLSAIKQILQHHLPNIPFNRTGADGHYENWAVTSDSSITLLPSEFAELPEGYFVQDIDLVSRILSYHTDDWHSEVSQILRVLHEVFSATQPVCKAPSQFFRRRQHAGQANWLRSCAAYFPCLPARSVRLGRASCEPC